MQFVRPKSGAQLSEQPIRFLNPKNVVSANSFCTSISQKSFGFFSAVLLNKSFR